RVRDNPPLERTAASVYFTRGQASRVRRRGHSTALRYAAEALQSRGCLVAASLRGGVRAVGAGLWIDRPNRLESRRWCAIDWIVAGARRPRAAREQTRARL